MINAKRMNMRGHIAPQTKSLYGGLRALGKSSKKKWYLLNGLKNKQMQTRRKGGWRRGNIEFSQSQREHQVKWSKNKRVTRFIFNFGV